MAVISTKIDQMASAIATVDTKVVGVDTKVNVLDAKVDTLDGKMQRIEGVVAVVRFLGVGGVAIAVLALLKAFGVEVVP